MTPRLQALVASHQKILAAYIFAEAAHGAVGQMRPTLEDPDVPYIVHPIEVAGTVAAVEGATVDMIVAAFLHDVVEDTEIRITTIRRLFGLTVGDYVMDLTDNFTPQNYPHLNRERRKAMEAERLSYISPEAKTVKLADLLSNTPSIALNKPKFFPVYAPEKRYVLEHLRGGDEGLWERADEMLKGYGY